MKPELEEAMRKAMPLTSKVLYAFQGKPYDEVRTKEVEDGWIQRWELEEPYPYRIPKTPEAYLDIINSKGEARRINAQWDFIMAGNKEHFFLLYENGAVAKAFASENCVIEANGSRIEFRNGEESALFLRS